MKKRNDKAQPLCAIFVMNPALTRTTGCNSCLCFYFLLQFLSFTISHKAGLNIDSFFSDFFVLALLKLIAIFPLMSLNELVCNIVFTYIICFVL